MKINSLQRFHHPECPPRLEFIRLIRMKRAAQYLEKSQRYVSEIAYMVGFNSPKVFARHFKEEFGMTPTEYQQMKQNRN